VGEAFYGEGTTMATSDSEALNKAKMFVYSLKNPDEWKKN
jgi:hypothetical protein